MERAAEEQTTALAIVYHPNAYVGIGIFGVFPGVVSC
jgi:hypothetical protein